VSTLKILLNFISGDITQKGYEKKRKKLLTPFFQPVAAAAKESQPPPVPPPHASEEQVSSGAPQLPPDTASATEPVAQAAALDPPANVSPASKNDLKIPSFIPVNPDETGKDVKRKTVVTESGGQASDIDSNLVTVISTEEITLLPSTSSSAGAEGAPAVPPHREGSVALEGDKKAKNGKPRSRNRHKR
jgi:hypothetical protein